MKFLLLFSSLLFSSFLIHLMGSGRCQICSRATPILDPSMRRVSWGLFLFPSSWQESMQSVILGTHKNKEYDIDNDISKREQGKVSISEWVRPDLKSEYETRYQYPQ